MAQLVVFETGDDRIFSAENPRAGREMLRDADRSDTA